MAEDNDMMVPAREFNAEAFIPADILERWVRPLVAEFIGPFALVFIGAGAIMTAITQGWAAPNDGGARPRKATARTNARAGARMNAS